MSCADPHDFVQHLRDRLAAVAADALRLAHANRHDLPVRFGEMIALAAAELEEWERSARGARLEREYGATCEENKVHGRKTT